MAFTRDNSPAHNTKENWRTLVFMTWPRKNYIKWLNPGPYGIQQWKRSRRLSGGSSKQRCRHRWHAHQPRKSEKQEHHWWSSWPSSKCLWRRSYVPCWAEQLKVLARPIGRRPGGWYSRQSQPSRGHRRLCQHLGFGHYQRSERLQYRHREQRHPIRRLELCQRTWPKKKGFNAICYLNFIATV